jgi:hypothetical protein
VKFRASDCAAFVATILWGYAGSHFVERFTITGQVRRCMLVHRTAMGTLWESAPLQSHIPSGRVPQLHPYPRCVWLILVTRLPDPLYFALCVTRPPRRMAASPLTAPATYPP